MPCMVAVDENDPTHTYLGMPYDEDLFEYTVDYTKKTDLRTRRWNTWQEGVRGWPVPINNCWNPPDFRRWGNRTFVIWGGLLVIAEMDGDRLIPRVMLGEGNRQLPGVVIRDGASWTPEQAAGKGWIWRDQNADGRMQANEFEFGDWPIARTWMQWHQGSFIDENGNLYYTSSQTPAGVPRGVVKFSFEGLDAHGFPIYRWDSARFVLTVPDNLNFRGRDGKMHPVMPNGVAVDREGYLYVSDQGDAGTNPKIPLGLLKFKKEGTLLWRVGRNQPGAVWHPGDLTGTGLAGLVDQRYLFVVDYLGGMDVWDTDGLWVARLFYDLPGDLFLPGETIGAGRAFRHPNGKVYAITAPDCIYRAARIIVDGLDNIERFEGQVKVTTVAAPRVMVEERPVWRVLRRQDPIRIDGEINAREWGTDTDTQVPESFYYLDDSEAARAWAQWDDEALYLAWRITDPTPAVNTQRGPDKWGGDQVEFMIRAKPGIEGGGGNMGHTAEEFQLAIGPGADGPSVVIQANGSKRVGQTLKGAEVAVRVLPGKDGYTMEARIPWAELGTYRPKKDDQVLWNMIIDWGTPDGRTWDHNSKWISEWHLAPSNWGTARFF